MSEPICLNTIEEAIQDLKLGKIIIVVDDEDRENEGDFVAIAETVTPEIINFMATHGRGLICTPIEESRADELALNLMVSSNTALHETAFTVSIDLIGQGCTTGISAYDRATGIKALTSPDTKSYDYARPGHIFPLRAKTGGVLRRTGHTEAAVDLARMAGYYPAGVLVEILNEDGTMARLPQLLEIAKKHELKIISIDDLVAYRMQHERIVRKIDEVVASTKWGQATISVFEQIGIPDQHLAIQIGEIQTIHPTLVRVHSSHETDDVLSQIFDQDGLSNIHALEKIQKEGKGILLLMRHKHESLKPLDRFRQQSVEHIKAINQRDFGVGAQILRELKVGKIRLLTNNPKRRIGLIGYGLEIVENIDF